MRCNGNWHVSNTEVAARLQALRARIASAAARAGRNPDGIRILAVTKAHRADAVLAGLAAGLADFGENFAQEGIVKMREADPGVAWHFIGQIQSNKTRLIAEHYDWVHTVIRKRIVRRLAAQRPGDAQPLHVCIQVRMQDEDRRPALPPSQVAELAALVREQPRLRLRGLMGLPLPDAPRDAYLRLRALYDELNEAGMNLDTLSMGMTADLETAVECGATLLRIGTALFGPRPPRTPGQGVSSGV